jgi:CBS domain containing-hemolysin-like protein
MTTLLLIVALLIGNGFFVGAEFGLISARRSTIELQAKLGSRSARSTLRAMERISVMLAGAQLGVTVCSLALGALGEPFIAHLLEQPFVTLGVPEAARHGIAFAVGLIIMTFLHVVFGEMVPKNIALARAERTATILTPILGFFVRVFWPVVTSLNYLANHLTRVFRIEPQAEITSSFTRDEVAGFVEESHREGLLSTDEEHLLSGSLEFDQKQVRSVLLPLETVVCIAPSATPAEIEQEAGRTGFSRFPIITRRKQLRGYVHLKDILGLKAADRLAPLHTADIRPLVTVKARDSLRRALGLMRESGTHMAQVIDQSGETLGVITLEDVLEELVGEIRDNQHRRKLPTTGA